VGTQDDEPTRPEPDKPLAAPPPLPTTPVEPVVVPRWVQLALLPIVVLGGYALVQAAGKVLLLFVISGLFALLLNPLVTVLRRRGLPRGLSVALVFLALISILVASGALLSDPIADQVAQIQDDVPKYIDDANEALDDLQDFFDDNDVNIQIADPGSTALETLGDRLSEGSGDFVKFTRDALTTIVESLLALILTLVLTVYLLLYGERIGSSVRRIVPAGDGTPEDDFPTRVQQAVIGYVRGQFLFSLLMGTGAGLLLFILGSLGIFPDGKTYALAFGVFFGCAEIIPYIGPAIGAAPPILIAAFSNEPIDAVWLIIAFTALQQIEGHIVAPNVFAQALRINPILVIAALLLGGQIYGFIGAFIALPIAAIIRETVVYFGRHLVLEPWPTVSLAGVGQGLSPPGPGPPCPECGAPVAEGAAYCAACGTELAGDADEAAARSAAPN
jgi:predicted PurR-regulated permease PerM